MSIAAMLLANLIGASFVHATIGPPRPVPASSPVLFAEFWPDQPVWTMLTADDGPDVLLATCAGGPVKIRGEVAAVTTRAGRDEASMLAAVTESPLADLAFARGLTIIARGDGRTYRVLIETLVEPKTAPEPRQPPTPSQNPSQTDSAPATEPSSSASPESARTQSTPMTAGRHTIEIAPPPGRWTRFTLPFDAFRAIEGPIDHGFTLPPDQVVAIDRPGRALTSSEAGRTARIGVVIDRTVPGPFRLEIASIALLDPARSIEDDIEAVEETTPTP